MVAHAMTDGMAAGRFPVDEPLNDLGHRQLESTRPPESALVVCGPELRARQSARQLGLDAEVEPALADLDVADWRGLPLDALDPEEIGSWLSEPESAPHGGESLQGLVRRVGTWMGSLTASPTRVLAVSHPAVIRAAVLVALDAPAISFWRIDVAPCSTTVLHHRGSGWTLRL